MSNLKIIVIGLCVFGVMILVVGCANQPQFCPEVKVSFFSAK